MAEPFQLYEGFLAALLLMSLVPVFLQYRRYDCRWFLSAYMLFTVASVATVVEAFVLPEFFNAVEHAGYMMAGIAFWLTAERSANDVVGHTVTDVLEGVLGRV